MTNSGLTTMTSDTGGDRVATGAPANQRLDKWLWYARVIKSRTLAAGLVTEGHVRVNRERVGKASHLVRPGDVVTVTVGPRVRILEVVAPGERRGPATEAQGLYRDLTPPHVPDALADAISASMPARAAGAGRPTKRDRRAFDRLQGDDDES